jgi:hypothetical protein
MVRYIMSAKLSRLRYPDARFLTILTIRLWPSPTALVRFSAHAVLSDPAGVSSDHRLLRSPTVAFQVFDPVGLRISHEALSLHLRYGPDIALSTLNPCRYLHDPKTRFPVEWLVPFPGRESHPLKAPGLPWRTKERLQVYRYRPFSPFIHQPL